MENQKGLSGITIVLIVIILVILVASGFIINNIYVSVYSEKANNYTYSCENGILTQQDGGLISVIRNAVETLPCRNFPNSKPKIDCENNIPTLNCQVTIYQKLFSK